MVRPFYRLIAAVLCVQVAFSGSPLVALSQDSPTDDAGDTDIYDFPPLEDDAAGAHPLLLDDPSFRLTRGLSAKGEAIDLEFRKLIRRHKFPNSPGTVGGVPTSEEVTREEEKLLGWKSEIQNALAQPTVESPDMDESATVISIMDKLQLINLYFNVVKSMAVLKVARDSARSGDWIERFALRIPKGAMDELPGFGASARDRTGQAFHPLIVDRGADGQAPEVTLRLSHILVQGIEVGALADDPTDANFTTLIKYMAIRQLLENLTEVRFLKTSREVTLPTIPTAFRNKLRSMGMLREMDEERVRAVSEPRMRQSLQRTHSAVEGIPAFANRAFVESVARVIVGESNEERFRMITDPLAREFADAESQTLAASIEDEIAQMSVSTSELPEEELARSLRFMAIKARANTILEKLIVMIEDQVIRLDTNQRTRIMALIDARSAELRDAVTDEQILGWARAARVDHEQNLFEFRREQFIENLYAHSTDLARRLSVSYERMPVDVATMSRAMAARLEKLQPGESVHEAIMAVASAPNFADARTRFVRIMTEMTSDKVLYNGQVDPARVEIYIESADFDPDMRFVEGTHPDRVRRMRESVIEGRKKDIRAFLQYGEMVGFTRAVPLENPTAADVLSAPSQAADLAKYYEELRASLLSQYPILMTEVSHRGEEKPLYEVLHALNPNAVNSREVNRAASEFVDAALDRVERRIHENVTKIAEADNLFQIEDVVSSSMLLQFVMTSFPEFRASQEEFLTKMQDSDFFERLFHKQVGPVLGYGFGAVILLKIAKWGSKYVFKKRMRPLMILADTVASPFSKGLFKWGTYVFVADVGYRAYEAFWVHRNQAGAVDSLFGSGAMNGGFYSWNDREATRKGYEESKWTFIKWDVIPLAALPVAFAMRPVVMRVVNGVRQRQMVSTWRAWRSDVAAFEALGLEAGTFDRTQILRAYRRVLKRVSELPAEQRLLEVHGETAAGVALQGFVPYRDIARNAARHLLNRIRRGRVWSADTISSQRPARELSRHEKKIRRALVRLGVIQ